MEAEGRREYLTHKKGGKMDEFIDELLYIQERGYNLIKTVHEISAHFLDCSCKRTEEDAESRLASCLSNLCFLRAS